LLILQFTRFTQFTGITSRPHKKAQFWAQNGCVPIGRNFRMADNPTETPIQAN
jgi:hypothetical protein